MRICSVEDCTNKHYGHGFCRNHMPRNPKTTSQKLAKKEYDRERYLLMAESVKDYGKKYYQENKEDVLARNKIYSQKKEARIATGERQKRNRAKHPEKFKARSMLNNAVISGKMIKPVACDSCSRLSTRIEGHHPDYAKPLEVIWLCNSCHVQEHKNEKVA